MIDYEGGERSGLGGKPVSLSMSVTIHILNTELTYGVVRKSTQSTSSTPNYYVCSLSAVNMTIEPALKPIARLEDSATTKQSAFFFLTDDTHDP